MLTTNKDKQCTLKNGGLSRCRRQLQCLLTTDIKFNEQEVELQQCNDKAEVDCIPTEFGNIQDIVVKNLKQQKEYQG